MEDQMTTEKLLEIVLDIDTVIPLHSVDMARRLLAELDGLIADYHRSMAIVHLSGNYSSKKHLCTTILTGLTDEEVKEIMQTVRIMVVDDLKSRGVKIS